MHRNAVAFLVALAAALVAVSFSAAASASKPARLSPDRLALSDDHGGSVRDRRRQAGRRRRPGLGLPGERAADESLRLHAERRGDRRLPPRPRPHLVQPGGLRRSAPQARDQGRDGARSGEPRQEYKQIDGIGRLTGHAAGAASVVSSMKKRMAQIIASVPPIRRHPPRLPRARPDVLLGDVADVHRLDLQAVRLQEHRRRGRSERRRTQYPQLSNEYIVASNPQIIVLADTKCCGQTAATVAARPGWGGIKAVAAPPRRRRR